MSVKDELDDIRNTRTAPQTSQEQLDRTKYTLADLLAVDQDIFFYLLKLNLLKCKKLAASIKEILVISYPVYTKAVDPALFQTVYDNIDALAADYPNSVTISKATKVIETSVEITAKGGYTREEFYDITKTSLAEVDIYWSDLYFYLEGINDAVNNINTANLRSFLMKQDMSKIKERLSKVINPPDKNDIDVLSAIEALFNAWGGPDSVVLDFSAPKGLVTVQPGSEGYTDVPLTSAPWCIPPEMELKYKINDVTYLISLPAAVPPSFTGLPLVGSGITFKGSSGATLLSGLDGPWTTLLMSSSTGVLLGNRLFDANEDFIQSGVEVGDHIVVETLQYIISSVEQHYLYLKQSVLDTETCVEYSIHRSPYLHIFYMDGVDTYSWDIKLPNLGENTFDNVLTAATAAGATLKIDFTGEGKLCLTTKEKGSSQVLTVYERGIFNIDPASSRGTDECSSLEMSLDDVISELVFEPGTYTFVEVIAQIMGFFEDLEVETTPKNALKFTYTKNTEHPMKVSGGSALEALGLSTNMEASWAMVEQEDLAYVIADNGLEIIAEESVSIRFPSPAVTILEALESLGLEAEEYKGVAYNVVLGSQNATTFFPPIRNGDTLRVVLETEKDFVITDVESYKLDTPIDADCPPTGYVLSKGQKSYLSQKANIKTQYNAFMDHEDDIVSIKNAILRYIQGKGSSPDLSDVLQVLDNISALADNLQVNSIEILDRFLKTLTSEKILLKMLMGIRIRELLGLDTEDTSNMAAAVKSTKSVLKLFTALEGADKLISEILARGSKTYG